MRVATTVAALCVLTLATTSCSAIYSFDEFHVGSADAALPDGARPDASSTPDGGDAGVHDAGTDAGLVCTGTMADCDGEGTSCETDLSTSRSNCGGCGARNACGATNGCWAGTCDSVDKLVFGRAHACALLRSKRVVCWGSNSHGQLGDGTRTSSNRPVFVALGQDATDVAAGAQHSCALLKDAKAIRCWGANPNGELGIATHEDQLLPATQIDVPTGGDFTGVTAGVAHTCGLVADSRVYCWGSNGSNQLRGGAGLAQSDTPRLVSGLVGGIESIEAGGATTCALASGLVVCWGLNDRGQRGTVAADNLPAPVQTLAGTDLVGAASVSVGLSHACAVTAAGALNCWGTNGSGELGDGTTTDHTSARQPFTDSVTAVAAGAASTCAVTSAGTYCWGSNRDAQAQRAPDDSPHALPQLLTIALPSTAMLALEWSTACAVTPTTLTCWGNDAWGQAGRQTESLQQPRAVDVMVVDNASALGAGADHACIIDPSRLAMCWGDNEDGQLGDGSRRSHSAPAPVRWGVMPSSVVDIAGGATHTCASGTEGGGMVRAWCWGANDAGQLGNGTLIASVAPVTVLGTTDPSGLAVGANHACLSSADTLHVQCWGANETAQAGAAAGPPVTAARDVVGLPAATPIRSVAAGADQTCVVAGSDVYCLGNNAGGLLGLPLGATTVDLATQVLDAPSATTVVAGERFTCVLAADATVSCWGRNGRGQLGDGSTTDRRMAAPTLALGGDVTSIAAGTAHVCVVAAVGGGTQVMCWGANEEGQCGAKGLGVLLAPTPVPDTGDIVGLAAGRDFTCGRRTSGEVKCWGSRAAGRLGDGVTLFEPTAAPPFWSP